MDTSPPSHPPEKPTRGVYPGPLVRGRCVRAQILKQQSMNRNTENFSSGTTMEAGWETICKSKEISVPPLDDLHRSGLHVPDQPPKTDYKYFYIELWHNISGAFNGMDPIPARNEHRQAPNYATDIHDKRTGRVVLLGQPGIGKSLSLYYILLYRIFYGKPTAFEPRKCRVISFRKSFKWLERIDLAIHYYSKPHYLSDLAIKPRNLNRIGTCIFVAAKRVIQKRCT